MKTIFLHIPKAGGSTLHSIINRNYAKENIFTISYNSNAWRLSANDFKSISPDKIKNITLLKGHMFFGLHKYLNEKDVKYFTFLRNPVERIISLYYFIRNSPKHYLYNKIIENNLSIKEFALSDISWELDNCMTRLISGEDNVDINNCTIDVYNKAIQNIDNYFCFVGISEKYDESLILLKNRFGWKHYPFYRKLNVTSGKKVVANEIRTKIAERNKFDMKLYEWAKIKLEEDIRTVKNFDYELDILRNTNIAYNKGFIEGKEIGYNNGLIKGAENRYNKFFEKYPLLYFMRKIKMYIQK